jgi:DNA-binding Xre family transcriptional regulator
MFKFDKLFLTMEKKRISTYKLREECGIDSKTVRRLRANENIEMKTLDKICAFLDCKIEDVVEFIKDEQ